MVYVIEHLVERIPWHGWTWIWNLIETWPTCTDSHLELHFTVVLIARLLRIKISYSSVRV